MPDEPASRKISETYVLRRIEFLLLEARSEHPLRDQTVTYAMRVVSNYCAIGQDAGSSTVKAKCRRMSRKALDLKGLVSHPEWIKKTINEHQEPLNQIWAWILKDKETLTAESILERFRRWPMVTVTCEEDAELRKYPSLGPAERYNKAGVEVLELDGGGAWVPEKRSSK